MKTGEKISLAAVIIALIAYKENGHRTLCLWLLPKLLLRKTGSKVLYNMFFLKHIHTC